MTDSDRILWMEAFLATPGHHLSSPDYPGDTWEFGISEKLAYVGIGGGKSLGEAIDSGMKSYSLDDLHQLTQDYWNSKKTQ